MTRKEAERRLVDAQHRVIACRREVEDARDRLSQAINEETAALIEIERLTPLGVRAVQMLARVGARSDRLSTIRRGDRSARQERRSRRDDAPATGDDRSARRGSDVGISHPVGRTSDRAARRSRSSEGSHALDQGSDRSEAARRSPGRTAHVGERGASDDQFRARSRRFEPLRRHEVAHSAPLRRGREREAPRRSAKL